MRVGYRNATQCERTMSLSIHAFPPSRVVIIADDLTSATDCGVQMMTGGYWTIVALRPEVATLATAQIVGLDTDSRNVSAQQAYQLSRDALAAVGDNRQFVVYKSIDSTLRGNLGAEIDAVMTAGAFDAALIAPAFPTYGRTTCNGQQLLNGLPIDRTEFGSDPTAPVTSSEIAVRIAEQSRYRTALVPLNVQRLGASAVFEVIEQRHMAGDRFFVFDAIEEGDLERLAGIVGTLPGRYLWVGSTGFSRYVPRAIGLVPQASTESSSAADGYILIVAGSASVTTRAQLDACVKLRSFAEAQIDSLAIAEGGRHEQVELARIRRLLKRLVGRSNVVALTLSAEREEVAATKTIAANRGLPAGQIETHLANTLGRLASELLSADARVKGLVLTGGTTAKTTLNVLQTDAIEILQEVEPGIPLCRTCGQKERLVVTKAGGFGGRTAIIKSVESIAGYVCP